MHLLICRTEHNPANRIPYCSLEEVLSSALLQDVLKAIRRVCKGRADDLVEGWSSFEGGPGTSLVTKRKHIFAQKDIIHFLEKTQRHGSEYTDSSATAQSSKWPMRTMGYAQS